MKFLAEQPTTHKSTARLFKEKSVEGAPLPFLGGAGITWANGLPVPTVQRQNITKDQFNALLFTASSLPYIGVYDEERDTYIAEQRFQGLTCAEVVAIRLAEAAAQGNLKAVEMLLDRTIGKPKQQIESVSMKMSYTEYLEHLAAEEQRHQAPTERTQHVEIDVTPTHTPTQEPDNEYGVDDPFIASIIAAENENEGSEDEYELEY